MPNEQPVTWKRAEQAAQRAAQCSRGLEALLLELRFENVTVIERSDASLPVRQVVAVAKGMQTDQAEPGLTTPEGDPFFRRDAVKYEAARRLGIPPGSLLMQTLRASSTHGAEAISTLARTSRAAGHLTQGPHWVRTATGGDAQLVIGLSHRPLKRIIANLKGGVQAPASQPTKAGTDSQDWLDRPSQKEDIVPALRHDVEALQIEPVRRAFVVVDRDSAAIHYGCGCVVRQFPSFKEAIVCPSHIHWKIEADLVRYR